MGNSRIQPKMIKLKNIQGRQRWNQTHANQIFNLKPQLLRVENEKTKKKSEDEAKTPAKNNTAIKNHKRLIRFKIEAVVKKPNHSASQEWKFPARRKGNITKVFKPSNSVTSTNAGKLEDYRHLRLGKDSNSFANELGCLTQGILDIEGTNYMRFINHN